MDNGKDKKPDKGLDKLRSKFAKKNDDDGTFTFSKSNTLKTFVRTYIKTLLFLSRVWQSIIFRFCVLILANVGLYFFLERVSSYKRYLKLVLIVNMAILFVFIPALYVIQSIYKKNIATNEESSTNRSYVITVFLTCIIFILIAISFYYLPYFFLTSTMNVSKVQKFILLFMVVFLYAMLFLMYNKRLLRLYAWINKLPFIPNTDIIEAVWNLTRYVVLYLLICLPIDAFRVCKGVFTGKQSLGTPFLILVAILILAFIVLYGSRLKDGVLSLNSSLVVLRRDQVYLNRRTNLGFYDDVVLWNTDRDRILAEENRDSKNKKVLVKRGQLEPVEEYNENRIAFDVLELGEKALDTSEGVGKTIYDVTTGKTGIKEFFEDTWEYLKENPIKELKDWLILPEDPESSWRQKRVGEYQMHPESPLRPIVEGLQERCPQEDNEKDDGLNVEEIKAIDANIDREMRYASDIELKYESNRVHQIAYSLSMWLYLAPARENHPNEPNLLNFSNKLILCLGKNGSTIYVDLDSEMSGEKRVAKRVFALDTFARQKWNHVVITTDHTGRMNAFVNGVLVATNDTVLPSTRPGNHMIYIGEKDGTAGMARDVYYYNKTLTRTDISLLYNGIPLLV